MRMPGSRSDGPIARGAAPPRPVFGYRTRGRAVTTTSDRRGRKLQLDVAGHGRGVGMNGSASRSPGSYSASGAIAGDGADDDREILIYCVRSPVS